MFNTAIDNKLFGTERNNPVSLNSHNATTTELLIGINDEDATIAASVRQAIPAITQLVDVLVEKLHGGKGSLYYIGAGTSGRLGVLDASECPPTYNVAPELVQGLMAGGDTALRNSIEGAEDDADLGRADTAHLTANDVLVGISASGSAVYVRGAIQAAKAHGIFTAGISTAPDAPLLKDVDCAILADVGAEFVAGSTRMKSGTAQKLILNMITTATMIRLGKVYAGRMIDVKISNIKLEQRAIQMIATLTGCSVDDATRVVDSIKEKTIAPVKPGIVMILEKQTFEQAIETLYKADDRIDAIMRKHARDVALGCA